MKKFVAIVLSAGTGSRMKSNIPKQYMDLGGKPVLYYSLKAFEENDFSSIILVCGKNDQEYCKKEIVDRYGFHKVHAIVAGGTERYYSVFEGLKAIQDADYVFVHDGARPFVDAEMINRLKAVVEEEDTAVAGMPVKDTIRIVDEQGYEKETPERKFVWQIQTPQCFSYELLYKSYLKLLDCEKRGEEVPVITDDAMVVSYGSGHKVKMVEGDYRNIKLTTPEDFLVAATFLKKN